MLRKAFTILGIALLLIIIVLNVYVLVSGKTFFYKALVYNFADVDDYKIFDNRTLLKSTVPQPWPVSSRFNQVELSDRLELTLDSLETFAFLIVKNDSLIYESYSDGYGPSSLSNSFSVAKSVVSILVGIALKEGKIESLDQPVGDFLPSFKVEGKEKISVKHLLMMSSGLNWDESYASPFSMTTEAYYGHDLPGLIARLEAIEPPGKRWKYLSGNTEVLAMVLEKATGKTVGEYAEEKLWQPLGMESDALWSTDKKNGLEKAYCCLNSNARDFAKIGKLYLHGGNWEGKQIVDSEYVAASITSTNLDDPNSLDKVDFYGYQWWMIPEYKEFKVFYARGILGQYIIVLPEQKIVIVRLGKKRGGKRKEQQDEVFTYIDEVMKL